LSEAAPTTVTRNNPLPGSPGFPVRFIEYQSLFQPNR
jgi:hypothetical protein